MQGAHSWLSACRLPWLPHDAGMVPLMLLPATLSWFRLVSTPEAPQEDGRDPVSVL